jgi:hypothetical protein
VSKCDQRVNASRPMRGHQARKQRHNRQQSPNRCEGYRVDWLHVEQHGLQKPSQDRRSDKSRNDADGHDQRSFSHRDAQDVAALRAHRYANADFIGSLAEGVGHHPTDSDRRQQQRHAGENSQQFQRESSVCQVFCDHFVHRTHGEHRYAWIDALHLATNRIPQDSRVGGGAQIHHQRIRRALIRREIQVWSAGGLEAVRLDVAGHSYDGSPLLLCAIPGLSRRQEVQPGFEPHHLITARIWIAYPNDPEKNPYRTVEARGAFLHEVLRRVGALPGVVEAGLGSGNGLPMETRPNQVLFMIDKHAAESERVPTAEMSTVTPEYFRVLKIPLIRGRVFTEADDSKGQPVALISETLARRYWHDEDPVGQQIRQQVPKAPQQQPRSD